MDAAFSVHTEASSSGRRIGKAKRCPLGKRKRLRVNWKYGNQDASQGGRAEFIGLGGRGEIMNVSGGGRAEFFFHFIWTREGGKE